MQPISNQFKHKFVNKVIDQNVQRIRARKAKSNLRNYLPSNINSYGLWNQDALKNNFVLS